uniref:Uncharacterized protein n=1 Tax=Amphimedon queenslandica TaxID=400682 RepID=A0A1X7U3F6_AMPQE
LHFKLIIFMLWSFPFWKLLLFLGRLFLFLRWWLTTTFSITSSTRTTSIRVSCFRNIISLFLAPTTTDSNTQTEAYAHWQANHTSSGYETTYNTHNNDDNNKNYNLENNV